MTPSELDELNLVELPAHKLFKELGYQTLEGADLSLERKSYNDVILHQSLKRMLEKLNPDLPDYIYEDAIRKVKSLPHHSLIKNNQAFHQMLLSGVTVSENKEGNTKSHSIKLVDFENPQNNEFLAVRQLHVHQYETRRPDHVIFVNGIPLVILEYKNPVDISTDIVSAFNQLGVTQYQKDIPRIFHYNAFLIISDRTNAKYGTLTAPFERFFDWNDPVTPDKTVPNRLELMQQLLLNKKTLLDVIQNYLEYESDGKNTIKKIAQHHQYYGVKRAIQSTLDTFKNGQNKIGIIWHTTGSGKSFTMILYTHMLSQIKELGNPTFIILTDRKDLDSQLNGFFKIAGFPYPKPNTAILEAEDILDLRDKLAIPAGKIIFTTIQKFQKTKEEREETVMYPKISDRKNIIILADEAHRSQYKKMAQNLQRALPNAMKIGFTGTPIEREDKSTTYVFGDVIDSYKISDAVRDKATVEISSQSRLVTLHLSNDMIDHDFDEITEGLDDDAKQQLSRKWSNLKPILEDPDRLKKISDDLVYHFTEKKKTLKGKAMLAVSTKLAAARYADMISSIPGAPKCTCIISGDTKKSDDLPHSAKIREEITAKHYKTKQEMVELIQKFKDPKNDLELLIVCDMYLTGFDVPIVHTMYIDKPLRDHNLIQAISRVNRIWKDKPNGMIIDYIGITDDLKQAFRSYNESDVKGVMVPTEEIILYMKKKHLELLNFFSVDIGSHKNFQERKTGPYLDNAIEDILDGLDVRKKFIQNVAELTKAYAVCTPHPDCQEVEEDLMFFQLMRKLMSKSISDISYIPPQKDDAVRELLEEGILADKNIRFYDIQHDDQKVDLNREYIEKIKKIPHKNLKMELAYKLLDDAIKSKLKGNLTQQKTFEERIKKTLSKYHGNFENVDTLFPEFESVAKDITLQTQRKQQLNLTDEEIAFYDIILMGKDFVNDDKLVRQVAIDVVKCIKNNMTVDWLNQDNVKAEIRSCIRKVLLDKDFLQDKIEKLVPEIMIQSEKIYGTNNFNN